MSIDGGNGVLAENHVVETTAHSSANGELVTPRTGEVADDLSPDHKHMAVLIQGKIDHLRSLVSSNPELAKRVNIADLNINPFGLKGSEMSAALGAVTSMETMVVAQSDDDDASVSLTSSVVGWAKKALFGHKQNEINLADKLDHSHGKNGQDFDLAMLGELRPIKGLPDEGLSITRYKNGQLVENSRSLS